MRRLIGLLAIGLAAVALPARAEDKVTRTEAVTYADPAIGTAGIGICLQGDSCVFVEPEEGERYVSIEITDNLGLPVYASFIQDTTGDGSWLSTDDYTVHFCGKTPTPLAIVAKTVSVWVWATPGVLPACAGTASSGTVKVTFSNLP